MVFWKEGIQIYDYCITPGSPDIHQFYVQNWLYWGFPTGISNRRYSNYCLSPGIARLEHDLKMIFDNWMYVFPSVVRCFGISIIFHLKTAFLCPLLCPAYEGPKPSQKSIIFYLKTVFHAFGICRTHGVTNEYLLFENNLVELSGFPHEILSSIWKVFFSTPRISSIWKINSITDYLLFEKWFESPSLNQKS